MQGTHRSGKNLLTPSEAAARLGLKNVNTLAVWRSSHRHDLAYVRIGRHIRYEEAEIERFISERTVRFSEITQD